MELKKEPSSSQRTDTEGCKIESEYNVQAECNVVKLKLNGNACQFFRPGVSSEFLIKAGFLRESTDQAFEPRGLLPRRV